MGQPMPQQFPILLSTMNDVPGYRVVRVMGEVFGLTVRSRNAFSNMGAGFKAMARGANAVLAMRFDCNEIGGTASEIAAYGTAVYLAADGQPPQQMQQPGA